MQLSILFAAVTLSLWQEITASSEPIPLYGSSAVNPISDKTSWIALSNTTQNLQLLSKRGKSACPEDFGAAPIACSACGGEDALLAGHCLRDTLAFAKCQCVNADSSASPPVLTIVTATQSDATVTGTYVLETISSLASLRQSFKTTLHVTKTESGEIETAAAVIMAGGVFWALAEFIGDAGAAEKILEAPKDAEKHPDDNTCPKPNEKCTECAGSASVCTAGASAGCVCERTECPSGNDTPSCTDPNCVPDENNKCTKEHPGCDCIPKEECPHIKDLGQMPFCEQCGGSNGKSRCKGVSDPAENFRWKDCPCMEDFDDPVGCEYTGKMYPNDPNERENTFRKFLNLPLWTDAGYSIDPNDKPPADVECQRAGWSAPQRDPDGSPSIASSVAAWCTEIDGKPVSQQSDGTGIQFRMYPTSYYSYWLSAGIWSGAPSENQCGDTSTITKDECEDILNTAMITCDPNSGGSHGASMPGSCIQYNITMSPETNPESPPWRPVIAPAPECDLMKMSGVTSTFFAGVYPTFCGALDSGDKTRALSRELTNKDFKAPSRRWLDIRTPPPDGNQQDGVKMHFKWTGSQGDCRSTCSEAFDTMVKGNCGSTGSPNTGMTLDASFNVGCGVYAYSMELPPKDPPLKDTTCNGTSEGYYVSGNSIYQNYPDFCNKVSALGLIEGGTIHTEIYNDQTPDKVELSAAWGGDATSISTQVPVDECNNAMKNLLDNCDIPVDRINQRNYKNGGSFKLNNAVYSIRPTEHRRTTRPNDANHSCWMWYKGLWNTFDIKGYGFADADHGDKLLHHIRNCGAVSNWSFKYEIDSSTLSEFEWHASGRLPIGQQQWECIGNAISSASSGGTGSGGCSGQ